MSDTTRNQRIAKRVNEARNLLAEISLLAEGITHEVDFAGNVKAEVSAVENTLATLEGELKALGKLAIQLNTDPIEDAN